jgi:hypothetical protein
MTDRHLVGIHKIRHIERERGKGVNFDRVKEIQKWRDKQG